MTAPDTLLIALLFLGVVLASFACFACFLAERGITRFQDGLVCVGCGLVRKGRGCRWVR